MQALRGERRNRPAQGRRRRRSAAAPRRAVSYGGNDRAFEHRRFRELRARLNSASLGLYPGSHGDVAQALALAVWSQRGSRSDVVLAGSEVEGEWKRRDPLGYRRSRAEARAGLGGYEEGDALPLSYDSTL